MPSTSEPPRQVLCSAWNQFQVFWAFMGLVLFSVTWKLWAGHSEFPQIPFFSDLTSTPRWVDSVCLGLAFLSLGSLLAHRLLNSNNQHVPWAAFSGFCLSATGLVLLDQLRLQPWVYQFIIFSGIMACSPQRAAWIQLRWIAISIYLYSAISKLDYQFANTTGIDFLTPIPGWTDEESDPSKFIHFLVLLLPLYELTVGLGLALKKTHRLAKWGVIFMHGTLIALLGPWGLGHQPGVLVWNAYLLGQAIFLFRPLPDLKAADQLSKSTISDDNSPHWIWRYTQTASATLTLWVLAFPATTLLGICDHWLAWEVYAPRSSRAKLETSPRDLESLPASLRPEIQDNAGPGQLVNLDLGNWSIHSLGVPIYPEDRFQFAVAVAVVEKYNLQSFQVHIGSVSHRWTGKRNWVILRRQDELKRFRKRFFWNTLPRRSIP